MGSKTMITVDEFDQLEEEEFRYDLDEGALITMTRPRAMHARIERRLIVALQTYLDRNPVGEVFGADILFVLGPTTKRAPDVSVILRSFDPAREIQGAPELAIEILSPSNQGEAIRRKIAQYFAAQCRLVWVVDMEAHTVEVWTNPEDPNRILREGDALEAPELLPGFSLPVARLF